MIFRRRDYPLPKFPPNVAPGFRSFCEALPPEKAMEFRPLIHQTMKRISDLAKQTVNVNEPMAAEVAKRCERLLDLYPQLTSEHQAFAIGAIRYFVNEDAAPDVGFASGFSDDVAVMNHVLEELGLAEEAILTP